MAAMASKLETVLRAMQAQLVAITGGTNGYVYTPDLVDFVMDLENYEAYLDEKLTTIFLVRPTDGSRDRQSSNEVRPACNIEMVVATKYIGDRTELPASEPEQSRIWQTADLIADVHQCLLTDPSFGQEGISTSVARFEEHYGYHPKWCLAGLGFTVNYRYAAGGR
jgi:hypothetical protein